METWSSYIDGLGREGCATDPAALLRPGLELELVRQPADMGRPLAVALFRRGILIGYLPKPDARPVAKLMDQGGRVRAFVLALNQDRRLGGRRLRSVSVEIEALGPPGLPDFELDRPDGADGDVTVVRRRGAGIAFYARTTAALCIGVVAVAAWAGMPDPDKTEEPQGVRSLALAPRASGHGAEASGRPAKTQERPLTAPVAATAAPVLPEIPPPVPVPLATGADVAALPLMPEVDTAAPVQVVPVAAPASAAEPAGVPVAAGPGVEAVVPLPIAAPTRASVPLPLPRPALPRLRPRRR